MADHKVRIIVEGKDQGAGRTLAGLGDGFKDLDKASKAFTNNLGPMGRNLSGLVGTLGSVNTGLVGVAAGTGIAVAGLLKIGVASFQMAKDTRAATADIQTQLGVLPAEAEKFANVAKNVYGAGLGASMSEVGRAVADTSRILKMSAEDPATERMTENAFKLRDAFGVEVTESLSAAKTLMDNFGISGDEAFDLITTGFQKGLDRSGDFLDTINEYGTQFRNAGADEKQFFSIMETGLAGGMLGTDKAADAFKEFQVRILDGSKATNESLAMLGINAEAFTNAISSGQVSGAQAFALIIDRLNKTENGLIRQQAGVGLIGTQFEDLGVDAALGLSLVSDSFDNIDQAVEGLDVRYRNWGHLSTTIGRRTALAFSPVSEALLEIAAEAMPAVEAAFGALEERVSQVVTTFTTNFDAVGGGIKGLVAGVGSITGGTVEYSATANVVEVAWNKDTWDLTTTYDANANVLSVDWTGQLPDSIGGGDAAFRYNTEAGITYVHWNQDGFTVKYDAEAQIAEADVLWGFYTYTYDAGAQIQESSLLWGGFFHSYDAGAEITEDRVLWGAWEKTYDAKAEIEKTSVLWGQWTYTYNVKANVGAWTFNGAELKRQWDEFIATTPVFAVLADIEWSTPAWLPTFQDILTKSPISYLAEFDWPPLPEWLWPSLPAWAWPLLPTWTWPDIPRPAWLDSLLSWRPFGGGGGSSYSTDPAASSGGGSNSGGSGGFWDFYDYVMGTGQASGTDFWRGGWTWVGEEGPELLNLPRGSQILSNPESKKMIGQLADGTTNVDTLMNTLDPYATSDRNAAYTPAALDALFNQFADTTADKIEKAVERGGDKLARNLEGVLQKIPGVFSPSEVTADQMRLADLGVPQNFADDWLRRLTDEVVNGADWEGVDIKDAARRAGIDESLPDNVILEMVKSMWADQSFFANKDNLELYNMDAVQAGIDKANAQSEGRANILAHFGITPEQATAQGVALGGNIRTGVEQGISGGGVAGASGGGVGSSIVSGLTAITPEQMAPVASSLATGLAASFAEQKLDLAGPLIGSLNKQLGDTESDLFSAPATTILGRIASFWGGEDFSVDFVGPLARVFGTQLDGKSAADHLGQLGERIANIIFGKYKEAIASFDWVGAVPTDGGAAPAAATVPGNAGGTSFWAGGLTWVGEEGPELVNLPRGAAVYPHQRSMAMAAGGGTTVIENHYHVASPLDVQQVAHQVARVLRGGR